MDLAATIRDVPDFPMEGILFKDITTLLQKPDALKEAVDRLSNFAREQKSDVIVGVESRGFIFGMPIAYNLGLGFVPVRKPGKLPSEKISESYTLEYGTNTLEIHTDSVEPGQRILVVDDLLATGGTALATCKLIERLGGVVAGVAIAIELDFLHGRDKLSNYDIYSIMSF